MNLWSHARLTEFAGQNTFVERFDLVLFQVTIQSLASFAVCYKYTKYIAKAW